MIEAKKWGDGKIVYYGTLEKDWRKQTLFSEVWCEGWMDCVKTHHRSNVLYMRMETDQKSLRGPHFRAVSR